jgi:hypothetical protein
MTNKDDKSITRRDFVSDAGKVAVGAFIAPHIPMIVPRHVLGGVGYQAPSDTVNFAVIGFGGQGSVNGAALAGTEQLVAVCDVDQAFAHKKMEEHLRPRRDNTVSPEAQRLQAQYEKAAKYTDFREMLQKEKGIDGVVVATPDHVHAVAAKAAMDLGKHVYVQKPLTVVGARGAPAAKNRACQQETRHADGQSGSLDRWRAADQRVDRRGHHWSCARGGTFGPIAPRAIGRSSFRVRAQRSRCRRRVRSMASARRGVRTS